MITSFSELPSTARIWVFPASRKLYPQEIPEFEEKISAFIASWPEEGDQLMTGFQILYKHFLIIGIDEGSEQLKIEDHDALVLFIQKLEREFNIDLIDRINVTYKQGEYVQYKEVDAFKKMIKNRSISKNTVVFDNMISTKEELKYDWEIPIHESWLKHLFPK